MRIVIQRVGEAGVCVNGEVKGEIGKGMMVLVGVEVGDTLEDAEWLAKKTAGLRIFSDDEGVMNLSIGQVDGEVLAISQFTLMASTRKGNRPSYVRAAGHELAVPMYEAYCRMLGEQIGKVVKKGVFGADMQVSLVNDGPVTIIMDSRQKEF